jgi:hypothetical protein
MKSNLPKSFDFVVRKSFKTEEGKPFEKGYKFKSFVKTYVEATQDGFVEMFLFTPTDGEVNQFTVACQYVKFATDEVEVKDN